MACEDVGLGLGDAHDIANLVGHGVWGDVCG